MKNQRLALVAAMVSISIIACTCEVPIPKPTPTPTRVPPTPAPHAMLVDDAVDFGTGKVRRIGKGWPQDVIWSPDGTHIVAATTSGIYLYEGNHLTPIRHLFSPVWQRSVAISPDNRLVVSGDHEGKTKLTEVWDTTTGAWIRTLADPQDPFTYAILDATFSRDGRYVTLLGSQVIWRWDVVNGTLLNRWHSPQGSLTHFAMSPDGAYAAAVGEGKGALWSLEKDSPLATLEGLDDYAKPVFNATGSEVLFAGREGEIKVIETRTGNVLNTLRVTGVDGYTTQTIAMSKDGKRVVAGIFWFDKTGRWTAVHRIALWDLDSTKLLHLFTGVDDEVNHLAFTADGRHIISGSTLDQSVELWGIDSQKLERTIDDYAYGFDLNSEGTALLTWGYGALKLWDGVGGKLVRATQRLEGEMRSATYSPDGTLIAFGVGNDVMIRDAHNGEWVSILRGHVESVDRVIFSPDGTKVASASLDQTIRVWNVRSGSLVRTISNSLPQFIGPGGYNYGRSVAPGIAFSPDGTQIASGTFDKVVRLWDVNTGRLVRTFGGHGDDVTTVAINLKGTRLASGSKEQTIKIWDMVTGDLLFTLEGHTAAVTSVAFNPDGTQLVSGSADNTIVIWNAKTGTLMNKLNGHTSVVNSVVYNHAGTRIASASADGSACVWDASSGKLLATDHSHTAGVESVAFSPDDTEVAGSSSQDGTIDLWRYEP